MPELVRFFGIIIRMFVETGERHHMPHIHVYYQEYMAIYTVDPIELLAGELPRRQQRLVEAWMELYQNELLENWHRAQSGEPVQKMTPLQR